MNILIQKVRCHNYHLSYVLQILLFPKELNTHTDTGIFPTKACHLRMRVGEGSAAGYGC